MKKKQPCLFGLKVAGSMILFVVVLFAISGFVASCAVAVTKKQTHYYKIQRLNLNGDVLQTYYSTTYPCGTEAIVFIEYPSGKEIKFKSSYTAEDLGTNKPNL